MADIDKLKAAYNELAEKVYRKMQHLRDHHVVERGELYELADLIDELGQAGYRYGVAVAHQPTASIVAQLREATERAIALNPAPYDGFEPPEPPETPAPAALALAELPLASELPGRYLTAGDGITYGPFTPAPVKEAARIDGEPRSLPVEVDGYPHGGRPGREHPDGWTTREAQ